MVPAGNEDVRSTAHLIASLRHVLHSELPIQIAYAGDHHLSPGNRSILRQAVRHGAESLDFLDLLGVFDDATLRLGDSKSAIKKFAVLASKFENVLLAEPETVFLQRPEVLFQQPLFTESGAFFFQGRHSLGQRVPLEQHRWWRIQITQANSASTASSEQEQDFILHGKSGVLLVNKSRVDVWMGLLHNCWQNTYDVRHEAATNLISAEPES